MHLLLLLTRLLHRLWLLQCFRPGFPPRSVVGVVLLSLFLLLFFLLLSFLLVSVIVLVLGVLFTVVCKARPRLVHGNDEVGRLARLLVVVITAGNIALHCGGRGR
uniref:(northern house mosquito) hypothetical protein n=1 Tax=Culex pipiens TaxID=7175 RepID=A0A8D8AWT5_CULPI